MQRVSTLLISVGFPHNPCVQEMEVCSAARHVSLPVLPQGSFFPTNVATSANEDFNVTGNLNR